jgi:hypothetical protein
MFRGNRWQQAVCKEKEMTTFTIAVAVEALVAAKINLADIGVDTEDEVVVLPAKHGRIPETYEVLEATLPWIIPKQFCAVIQVHED